MFIALAGAGRASEVTYEVPWVVTNYPSSEGDYDYCGVLAIDDLPVAVLVNDATFNATGTVMTSVTYCPAEEPWGMNSFAALIFGRTSTVVPSLPRIYQDEWAGSFDLMFEEPQEVRLGDPVLVCFVMRPATPDCVVTGPYPAGTVQTATLTLKFDSPTPTNQETWGGIKALYRLPAN